MADLDGRRFVFSANPGRSGSGFLAQLLDGSPDIDAGHERLPTMTGPWLRRIAHLGPDESRAARRVKIAAISYELERLAPTTAYCDTSHMFARTFADVVFEVVPPESMTVIVLRRDPRLTARSYFELGLVSHDRGTWQDWMISPTARAARFRIAPADVQSPFDLVFGSLVDAHVRAMELRAEHPDALWVDVELSDLLTADGAGRLFSSLGVRAPDRLESLTTQVTNTKPVEKSRLGRSVSRQLVEDRYSSFIDRFGTCDEVREFVESHPGGP